MKKKSTIPGISRKIAPPSEQLEPGFWLFSMGENIFVNIK
jgi:hypothetical protein